MEDHYASIDVSLTTELFYSNSTLTGSSYFSAGGVLSALNSNLWTSIAATCGNVLLTAVIKW